MQQPNSVWTFDGTMPPKLLMARYGEPILFRHYNALPIDAAANNGFGAHTITTHEHNGHNPAESDGFAAAFFFPGQFYDYHWPMVLAGHDSDQHHRHRSARGDADHRRRRRRDPHSRRLARNHEHALVPRPHARFHRPERLQGQRRDDELLQRGGSRPRRRRLAAECNYTNPANVNLCLPSGTALALGQSRL